MVQYTSSIRSRARNEALRCGPPSRSSDRIPRSARRASTQRGSGRSSGLRSSSVPGGTSVIGFPAPTTRMRGSSPVNQRASVGTGWLPAITTPDRIRREALRRASRGEVVADAKPDAGRAQRPDAAPHGVEGGAVEPHQPPVGAAAEALGCPVELGAAINAGDHVDRHHRPIIADREWVEAGHRVVELEVERRVRPEAVDAVRGRSARDRTRPPEVSSSIRVVLLRAASCSRRRRSRPWTR